MFADEYIWDYFCTVSDLRKIKLKTIEKNGTKIHN
jgi:hypothetical protein